MEFRAEETGELLLAVEDNGPGLPHGFELEQAKSLGLKMIKILSRQIKGQVDFCDCDGTRVEIRFRVPHVQRQPKQMAKSMVA
ncbi:MAG: hypothetical protein J6386_17460 [Candidatus Synoicihabitans palmerolidicus]|nr:hypothetical protein [Candidatus Synoicihabitans palmerolidicus]